MKTKQAIYGTSAATYKVMELIGLLQKYVCLLFSHSWPRIYSPRQFWLALANILTLAILGHFYRVIVFLSY